MWEEAPVSAFQRSEMGNGEGEMAAFPADSSTWVAEAAAVFFAFLLLRRFFDCALAADCPAIYRAQAGSA